MWLQARRTLWIIFWISLLGTLWSLYLSHYGDPLANILSWELWNKLNGIAACDLCRYIRIIMFPLPIITGIALWQRDEKIWHTILIMALIGFWFAFYKYGMQYRWFGNVLCDWRATTPCSGKDVEYFWFISMAMLGMVAFSIMIGLSTRQISRQR